MLPKQYRLKNRSAFKATYRVKNSFHKGGITLFIGILKKDDSPTKVGFVVSKRFTSAPLKEIGLKGLCGKVTGFC